MKILSVGPPGLDSSGYGELQRRVVLALEDLGCEITLRPFSSANILISDPVHETRLKKMASNPIPPPGSPQIFFCPAPMFQPNPDYYNIGFTMTEVDRINREWVEKCNSMDEVWVPSRFNYDAFSSQGIRAGKLSIMHLGVDTGHFYPAPSNIKEKFAFISSFELIPRKACDVLLEAFCEEFKDFEPIELLLKAYENGGRYDSQGKLLEEMVQKAGRQHPHSAAVTLEKRVLPYPELPQLYQQADCYVSASRGEGWNLPAMEAMACGLPVLACNWSGQTEFLTPENSFLMEVPSLQEIANFYCTGARWAAVDKALLRRTMRYAVEHPAEVRRKGVLARASVEQAYSINLVAKQILARLRQNAQSKKKPVALVGCGNWGKNYVRILLELDTEVVICDPALENSPYTSDARVKLSSFNVILNNPKIGAVFIVTPASTHYLLAKRALQAGKNVFVEKPFTLSSAEAEELSSIAQAGRLVLMVGHIMRYHPAVQRLKELVDSGHLGEIVYLRANRTSLGSVRSDVGVLWDLAVHDIDLACFLIGREPLAVSALTNSFCESSLGDVTVMRLTFPCGAAAHFFASWLDPFKRRELIIVGSNKTAIFDDASPTHKLALLDADVLRTHCRQDFMHGEFPYQFPFVKTQEPLRNEISHFLAAVKNHSSALSDAQNAVAVTRILEAAELSALKGGATVTI